MALTPAQLQTVKTYIAAQPALAAKPMTSAGASEIAAVLAENAVPDFWVWRTDVTRSDVYHSTSADGTMWNWTTYKTQSAQEQNAWVQIFMGDRANFSLANLRAGVDAIFSGAGAPAAQRAHITSVARRRAKQVEKILATGTGSVASPAVMGFEGSVSSDDVQLARELP